MKTIQTDVAIIGAGTAGLNARREVDKAGGSWVMIENGPYGTTCARVGCMPSKLLIAAAEAAHEVSHADRFGVVVENGGWRVDGKAVMDRVRRERDRFAGFVVEATERLPEERRLRGTARFVAPNVLEVDDHTRVEAKAVVIATGSSPWIPPQLESVYEHILVNDHVFEWTDLPASVAVVGTGVIGMELGQALDRLGVRVSFFNPFEVIGPLTDPAVAQTARDVFGAALDMHLGAQITHAETAEGGIRLTWTDADGSTHNEVFEHVLAAAGRRPNVGKLNLDAAGLELDGKGIPVHDDRTMRCGSAPIFVAGDVCNHLPLLHEAADEGRIAGANAMRLVRGGRGIAAMRRTTLAVAFTDPQIAMVGKRYADLDPNEIEVGEVSYADQGRSRVMGKNAGLVRVYAERSSCRLIGAEMFGPRVEHTSHLLAWAVQQGLRVHEILRFPFYHPVVEEGIRTALRDLGAKLEVTGHCAPEDFATASGE